VAWAEGTHRVLGLELGFGEREEGVHEVARVPRLRSVRGDGVAQGESSFTVPATQPTTTSTTRHRLIGTVPVPPLCPRPSLASAYIPGKKLKVRTWEHYPLLPALHGISKEWGSAPPPPFLASAYQAHQLDGSVRQLVVLGACGADAPCSPRCRLSSARPLPAWVGQQATLHLCTHHQHQHQHQCQQPQAAAAATPASMPIPGTGRQAACQPLLGTTFRELRVQGSSPSCVYHNPWGGRVNWWYC